MKVSRDYTGNLIQHGKTQSLYEKKLIGSKRAVFNFSNRQWGRVDPRTPPPPRAYATGLVVACLNKMLHGNYLSLEEFNKTQIDEVRSKIQAEKSETRATPKRVWKSRFVPFIASPYFSRDRRIKIKKSSSLRTGELFENP